MILFSFVKSSRMTKLAALPKTIKSLIQSPPPFGSRVEISGWVSQSRISKNVAFLDVIDGSTNQDIKVVVKPPSLLNNVGNACSVKLQGVWSQSKGKQPFELQVSEEVKLLGSVEDKYPLTKKDHTMAFLRTIPQYKWRLPAAGSILRFRSAVESSMNEFFQKDDFVKVQPPLITAGDCEGAGELFRIESDSKLKQKQTFFGKEVFMTVSTQLHLEVLCLALGRVWCLSPCFRAEESDTNRHLAEFWMLEAELAFVDDVDELTVFVERMIKHVVSQLVQDHNRMQSDLFGGFGNGEEIMARWEMLMAKKWDSITYTKAVELCQEEYKKNPQTFTVFPNWGDSLRSEHEKWLAGVYFENPVFVTDYPADIKAFYMKRNADGKTVACFDMLVPDVGELVGGSVREHDLIKLEKEIEDRQMNAETLNWYLDQRKNGSVPHGGFGMGFERLLQYLTKSDNIKDMIPFSRSTNSCQC